MGHVAFKPNFVGRCQHLAGYLFVFLLQFRLFTSLLFLLFLFALLLIYCLDYSCLHPLGPFILCGSCTLILCVLTPHM